MVIELLGLRLEGIKDKLLLTDEETYRRVQGEGRAYRSLMQDITQPLTKIDEE